jgi:hypothetical protein
MKITKTFANFLSSFLFLAAILVSVPSYGASPTVTITGKMVDRQCSVEDVYQLQPSTDKRCTLWIQTTFSCPAGTCQETYTVYCPRKAVDNRPLNTAYDVCSDPAAMQIIHPSRNYTISGYLRTAEEQKDGLGQIHGTMFSY